MRLADTKAKKHKNNQNEPEDAIQDAHEQQPYLQRKGELEAEERWRHELNVQRDGFEVGGDAEFHEIPGGTYEHRVAVMRTRQEVAGDEISGQLR